MTINGYVKLLEKSTMQYLRIFFLHSTESASKICMSNMSKGYMKCTLGYVYNAMYVINML